MKKLSSLFIMLSVIVFANTALPSTNKTNSQIQQPHKQIENKKYVKRGCCSHHGGVCGCNDNGRQVCCDGTLSPTCTCNHSTPLPEQIH